MDLTNEYAQKLADDFSEKVTYNTSFNKINKVLKSMGLNKEQVKFLNIVIDEIDNNAFHRGQVEARDFYLDIYDD